MKMNFGQYDVRVSCSYSILLNRRAHMTHASALHDGSPEAVKRMYQLLCAGKTCSIKFPCRVVKVQLERDYGVSLDDVEIPQKYVDVVESQIVGTELHGPADAPHMAFAIAEPPGQGYYAKFCQESAVRSACAEIMRFLADADCIFDRRFHRIMKSASSSSDVPFLLDLIDVSRRRFLELRVLLIRPYSAMIFSVMVYSAPSQNPYLRMHRYVDRMDSRIRGRRAQAHGLFGRDSRRVNEMKHARARGTRSF